MSSSWPPQEQPPSGWQPGSPHQPPSTGARPIYPQQTLSQQEVKPGRNRKPLYLGLLAAVLLVIGGLVAWQLLKDDGEDTRAAYCAELKDLTHDGDLTSALNAFGAASLNQLETLHALAPNVVRDDWDTLRSLFESAQSYGKVDFGAAAKAFGAARAIADDAKSECGIPIDAPGLP